MLQLKHRHRVILQAERLPTDHLLSRHTPAGGKLIGSCPLTENPRLGYWPACSGAWRVKVAHAHPEA